MAMKDLIPWRSGSQLPARRERDDELMTPFLGLRDQMNRMFDDFFRGFDLQPWSAPEWGLGGMAPTMDLDETETEYRLTAELPGLDEKDIEVRLANDVLTIRGSKQHEEKDEREGHRSMRRSFGSFHRSFTLPQGVDRDHIKAELGKGVLTLTLPKTEEARAESRRIEVHGK